MRPIKDIIAEEYWNIGLRLCPEEDSVVLGNGKFTFKQLETDKDSGMPTRFFLRRTARHIFLSRCSTTKKSAE